MRSSWVLVLGVVAGSCTRHIDPPRVARPTRSLESVIAGMAGLARPLEGTSPFLAGQAPYDGGTRSSSRAAMSAEKQLAPGDDGGVDPDGEPEETRCYIPQPACNPRHFDRHAAPSRALGALGALLAVHACRPPEATCAESPARCDEAVNACLATVVSDPTYACGIGFRATRIIINEPWLQAQINAEPMSEADAQWLVLGLFAHEEGHMLRDALGAEGAERVNALARRVRAPESFNAKQREELFADSVAGCVMARTPRGTASSVMKFIAAVQRMTPSQQRCEPDPNDTHPCVCLRNQALRLGWEECAGRELPDFLAAALPGCPQSP